MARAHKKLIVSGIVRRKAYDEVLPWVEYSLTDKGVSVAPSLWSVSGWSRAYHLKDGKNRLRQCQRREYRRFFKQAEICLLKPALHEAAAAGERVLQLT